METFAGINTLTEGLFGVSIIILLWVTIFFRQTDENNRDRIVAANFVAAFTGIIFFFVGIVNDFVLGSSIVLLIGSIALLMNR